ncbi:MAG: N-acetylneuraminate synthase family protein, partial [Phycisphaerae bacterium]
VWRPSSDSREEAILDAARRTEPPEFFIGDRTLGLPARAYVIAEAGVNHDGDAAAARSLIDAAAEAGADAVKFQVFSADRLATRQAATAGYQQESAGAASQHAMLSGLELDHATFSELAGHAARCGLDFIATPFSIADLEFLDQLGVAAVKLASPDIVNVPLLEAAARTNRPVIASTGAADLNEVADAVALFDRLECGPLALLHCVSSYPTPDDEANLAAIGALSRAFGRTVGFSDHTTSIDMGGYALLAGARLIEKHLTLDRDRAGPDHGFSLEPAMMAAYVRHIRQAEAWLGSGDVTPTPRQREVRRLARCSIVAACDLTAGQTLERSMLTLKRPGDGVAPKHLDRFIGRRLRVTIAADTSLSWDMVTDAAPSPTSN